MRTAKLRLMTITTSTMDLIKTLSRLLSEAIKQSYLLRSKHGGMLRPPSLLTLNHTMIELTTLQTVLEIGMLAFLGALAFILWE